MPINIKDSYELCINEALKTVKAISDPYQKVSAYAQIALALSGPVQSKMIDVPSGKKALNDTGKDTHKKTEETDKKKEKPEEKETVAPTPEKEEVEEKETEVPDPGSEIEEEDEDWTEISIAKYNDEIQKLLAHRENYGDKKLNEVLSIFSEGLYKDVENDIKPANICAFLTYLDELEKDLEGKVD